MIDIEHPATYAAFGSWRSAKALEETRRLRGIEQPSGNRGSEEDFRRACRQLGEQIARAGHRLMVASDAPSTVDRHLVDGALSAPSARRVIHVVRSHARLSSRGDGDCSDIYRKDMDQYRPWFDEPELLDERRFPRASNGYTEWASVHEYMADSADKTLVVGGSSSTHRIANYVLGRGRKLIPIGSFGGAAADILKMLEKVKDAASVPSWDYREVLAREGWNDERRNAALYALGVLSDPSHRRNVFINYRRSDTKIAARLVRNALRDAIGEERVFLDTDSIRAGERFDSVILKELQATRVLLCLIGDRWLSAKNEATHKRRIDEREDFVRRELIVALNEPNMKVIPVVLENLSNLPKSGDLPPELSSLPERNAQVILTDEQMDESVERLVAVVKSALER